MELSDIRELTKNLFDGVSEQERPTTFGSIVEQIQLGMKDAGASLGPAEVRAFSELVFQNIDLDASPNYLMDVINGVRNGAKDADVPAYGDIPIEPLSTVSQMAERVTTVLIERFWEFVFHDTDADEALEQLDQTPISYHRLIEAWPGLERVIVDHISTHDYLPSDSTVWDYAVPNADKSMATAITTSLTDYQKRWVLHLVHQHINE